MTAKFILALNPDQNDYAYCQGEYQKSLGTLNGRSVWFNNLFSTIGALGLSSIPNSWTLC